MMFALTEIFSTLQGEGALAGARAVFVRFAGCNQWSGLEERREQDADRHQNQCAKFCDTDFSPRMKLTEQQLVSAIAHEVFRPQVVVFTGGEPGLQLTEPLVRAVRTAYRRMNQNPILAIETNGTVDVNRLGLDWICVSPKVDVRAIVQRTGQELKVVYPAYDPAAYAAIAPDFGHCYVSPEATFGPRSLVQADAMKRAAAWVMENPGWKLSTQMHKIVGLQ